MNTKFAVTFLDYGLWRNPSIARLLGALSIDIGYSGRANTVRVGWGRKPSGRRASFIARITGVPCCLLEDGFIRSVVPGRGTPSFSLVMDSTGIYYDAQSPSRLEELIRDGVADIDRTRHLIALWREQRVSKYNHLREYKGALPSRYVLVADQTYGDASIAYGSASAQSFTAMLDAAIRENPDSTILVKTHPDVWAGTKKGYFDPAELSAHPRVLVLAENVHPVSLIQSAEKIYTVTSQMGFEGLLWGKPVRTFGMPFYAGWGLTEDELPAPARRGPASIEQLVHATLIEYSRYIDPDTLQPCEPEVLINWTGLQRRMRERFEKPLMAVDFSAWKKPIIKSFFQGAEVDFIKASECMPANASALVWGMKPAPADATEVIRVEDGFLRSVGLGADLIAPLSWVIDRRGIYYDATRPSDLEHILQTMHFDSATLARAASLRAGIVASKMTKYNVGQGSWARPAAASRVILVPGQVESDASLAYGAPDIRQNIALLRAVRTENPDAYIVYKPHPDVVAGLRGSGKDEQSADFWCNEVIIDQPMGLLLDRVDEVHVLTSLAGFEALLRKKRVVTYGQPFYSGWGLTQDKCPLSRRTRTLQLDELVAGTLIFYPTYVSRVSGCFTTPEHTLAQLLDWQKESKGRGTWRKSLKRKIVRMFSKTA